MKSKMMKLMLLLAIGAVVTTSCKKDEDDDDDNGSTTVVYSPTTNFEKITARNWILTSIIQSDFNGDTEIIETTPECNWDNIYTFGDNFEFSVAPGNNICPGDTVPPDPDALPIFWHLEAEEEVIDIAGVDFYLLGVSSTTMRYQTIGNDFTYTYSAE